MALEPASELSYDERGYSEVVELEVVEFIDYYDNDKDQEKLGVPHLRRVDVEYAGQRRGAILIRRWKKI